MNVPLSITKKQLRISIHYYIEPDIFSYYFTKEDLPTVIKKALENKRLDFIFEERNQFVSEKRAKRRKDNNTTPIIKIQLCGF